jgi:hypothetical protein
LGVLESFWKLQVSGVIRPSFLKALSSESVTFYLHEFGPWTPSFVQLPVPSQPSLLVLITLLGFLEVLGSGLSYCWKRRKKVELAWYQKYGAVGMLKVQGKMVPESLALGYSEYYW